MKKFIVGLIAVLIISMSMVGCKAELEVEETGTATPTVEVTEEFVSIN